jgi:phage terminase large subunit
MSENPFLEFIDRYGPPAGPGGPVLLCREVFGIEPDPWQEEALRAYGAEERGISIRACHGPGKTLIAGVCAWHQQITRFPQATVVTAPSKGQLEDALVKEMLSLADKLPPAIRDLFEFKRNRIELKSAPSDSFFSARTAREEKPEALQGIHCDAGWVLLIADEASGIGEQIFEAAAGSMSGKRVTTILLSNPVRGSGFFFDTHHKLRDMWHTIHVSAADSPRVTDAFVEDIARRYGPDSNAYRVRVLGEFPKADLDTVIPYADVEAARERDIVVPFDLPQIWGLDVARYGDDDNCLLKRNRLAVLPDIKVWHGVNLMETAGKVLNEWKSTPDHLRPTEILIDSIGLGAGVADRLRELGLPVRDINVSETASARDRYRNLRAELWFGAREWLAAKDRVLPRCAGGCSRECPHERLASELTIPRYKPMDSSGKLMVESKDSMKQRGFKSPNVADAFVMTFASEPWGLVNGADTRRDKWGTTRWDQPLRRTFSTV